MTPPIPGILHRMVLTAGLVAGITGCTVERAAVTPEGLLEVLGPLPGFSPVELPGDWAMESSGDITKDQLHVITKDGLPALRVSNGENAFVIVRRTQAMLLSTPYLSWSWIIDPPSTPGFHPVRIIVGFHGGAPESGSWGGQPFKRLGTSLPPHDRAISLTWGESALQRGTLDLSQAATARSAPRYVVRGGRENAGTWWLENVDLADLYSRAWPTDEPSRAQIMFIEAPPPAAAHRHRPMFPECCYPGNVNFTCNDLPADAFCRPI